MATSRRDGDNAEGVRVQWTSHFGDWDHLPGGAREDAALAEAWRDRNVDAFKRRARQLVNHISTVMGQSFQFREMRKGDVIITRCPKHDEYRLGIFPSDAWEEGAIVWRNLLELGVDSSMVSGMKKVNCYERLVSAPRAFRRVRWLMAGQLSQLSDDTKAYINGIQSGTCSRALESKAPPVYADLLATARPLPSLAPGPTLPRSLPQPSSSPPAPGKRKRQAPQSLPRAPGKRKRQAPQSLPRQQPQPQVASGAQILTLQVAQAALGKRVRVAWADDEVYEGVLDAAESPGRVGDRVHVKYDDGDARWHVLAEEHVELCEQGRIAVRTTPGQECMICSDEVQTDEGWPFAPGCMSELCRGKYHRSCWETWVQATMGKGQEPLCPNCNIAVVIPCALP